MRKLRHDIKFYILEIAVLGIGFLILLNLDLNFIVQLIILFIILSFYAFLGIIRHIRSREMDARVVLEYIAVSTVIVLIYLLINIPII